MYHHTMRLRWFICMCQFYFPSLFHSLTVSRAGGSTIIFHKAHDSNFSVDLWCVVVQIRLLFHLILAFTQQIWMTTICINKLLSRLYILTVTNSSLIVTNKLCVRVCEQLAEIQMKLMLFSWILSYDIQQDQHEVLCESCVNPLDIEFYFSPSFFVFWSNNTSTSTSY